MQTGGLPANGTESTKYFVTKLQKGESWLLKFNANYLFIGYAWIGWVGFKFYAMFIFVTILIGKEIKKPHGLLCICLYAD